MKVITYRDNIRNLAAKWREQYKDYGGDGRVYDLRTDSIKPVGEIQAFLDGIDVEKISLEEIVKIVSSTWILEFCDECGECCKQIGILGENRFCKSCIVKVLEKFKTEGLS